MSAVQLIDDTATATSDDASAAKNCGDGGPQLIMVQLSHIAGVHDAVSRVYEELAIPPLRFPALRARQDRAFIGTLTRHPIRVTRVKRRLRCVGDIRAFLTMRALLPPDTLIHCIEVKSAPEGRIRAACIAEFLYLPAIAGIHFSETRTVYQIARRAIEAGIWSAPESLEGYLSRLYGVDRRQFVGGSPRNDFGVEGTVSEPVSSPEPELESACGIDPPSETRPDTAASVIPENAAPQRLTYAIRIAGVVLGHFTPSEPAALVRLVNELGAADIVPVDEASAPTELSKQ